MNERLFKMYGGYLLVILYGGRASRLDRSSIIFVYDDQILQWSDTVNTHHITWHVEFQSPCRADVMNPKLEMSAVEQPLFSHASVIAPFLITLQPNRPAIPIVHLSGLPALMAPTFSYSFFDVFSRNRYTLSAVLQCDRVILLFLSCLLCD